MTITCPKCKVERTSLDCGPCSALAYTGFHVSERVAESVKIFQEAHLEFLEAKGRKRGESELAWEDRKLRADAMVLKFAERLVQVVADDAEGK